MIIDTEVHVLYFARWYDNNPEITPLIKHYTWHEHDGDLLIAEMDNAGVNRGFLISYDAEDTRWSAEQKGYGMEDFLGGRKYTLRWVRKYPDRFIWFNTIKNPKLYDAAALATRDFDDGAAGMKLFPAYVSSALTDPGLLKVFEVIRDRGKTLLISFETLRPPKSYSLDEYLGQLAEVSARFPKMKVALLHAGCGDPLKPAGQAVMELVRRFPNLYLSTSMPGEVWDDGTEYPFPNYLRRMETLVKTVGANRVMWATDWPWFDWTYKYEQALNAIRRHAGFLSEREKALVLGETAAELVGL
ncbi:MAG: amidohydrolase [Armatimonadetes bacterium]|nr:amidohydrolase [Armatimonadota bacterium]